MRGIERGQGSREVYLIINGGENFVALNSNVQLYFGQSKQNWKILKSSEGQLGGVGDQHFHCSRWIRKLDWFIF